MKRSWPYLLILVGVMVLIGYISQRHSGRRINWEHSYVMSSKIPYGCYLTNRYLQSTIHQGLTYTDRTLYNELRDSTLTGRNYVIINDQFQPSALDVIEVCEFVYRGNTAFISAVGFGLLGDSLGVVVRDPLYQHMQFDTTLNATMAYSNDTVKMNLVNPSLRVENDPVYDKEYISYAFAKIRWDNTTILGRDRSGYPNFIRCDFGRGAFYLHCMPTAFCNYYAGRKDNAEYIFGALTYLPDQATMVDRYYKIGKAVNDDSRRFILSQPALQLAYFILIGAATIALLFAGKRRQRPVPVIQGFRNSTLDFVEQIGALYYRNSDHTNIVHKKINYFLESVRARFYVSTNEIDAALVEKVTALSGVPFNQVNALFSMINIMRATSAFSDAQLKALDETIRDFNSRSKR